MGMIYYVVCRDCKIRRCLDKFYALMTRPKDRAEALEFAERMGEDGFRAGLLTSFMGEHAGHNCTIVCDMDVDFTDDIPEELVNWWGVDDELWDEILAEQTYQRHSAEQKGGE